MHDFMFAGLTPHSTLIALTVGLPFLSRVRGQEPGSQKVLQASCGSYTAEPRPGLLFADSDALSVFLFSRQKVTQPAEDVSLYLVKTDAWLTTLSSPTDIVVGAADTPVSWNACQVFQLSRQSNDTVRVEARNFGGHDRWFYNMSSLESATNYTAFMLDTASRTIHAPIYFRTKECMSMSLPLSGSQLDLSFGHSLGLSSDRTHRVMSPCLLRHAFANGSQYRGFGSTLRAIHHSVVRKLHPQSRYFPLRDLILFLRSNLRRKPAELQRLALCGDHSALYGYRRSVQSIKNARIWHQRHASRCPE